MTSVVIPVGPFESNKRWLATCIESVVEQTVKPNEILLIDDGANLNKIGTFADLFHPEFGYFSNYHGMTTLWKCPWRTGVAHAFNYGVALAQHECVIMLGSDDTLEPRAIEQALQSYDEHGRRDAYYYFGLRYMDTGEIQTTPCNAALVTKGFWELTGGFPIESALGRPDQMLLSICLKHRLPVYPIANGEPLYNYRRHDETWTAHTGLYHDELTSITNKVTLNWSKNNAMG